MSKEQFNQSHFYDKRDNDERQKAIIFLDHANIFHSIKDFKEIKLRIDYKQLKSAVSQGYFLIEPSYAYVGIPKNQNSEQYLKKLRFLKYLKKAGFNIVAVKLRVFPDGTMKQKFIDMLIHRDIIYYALQNALDVAILMSGDRHFASTIKFLHEMGKQVHVWSWEEALSKRLINAAGVVNVHYIDDIFDNIIKSKLK